MIIILFINRKASGVNDNAYFIVDMLSLIDRCSFYIIYHMYMYFILLHLYYNVGNYILVFLSSIKIRR